MSPPESKGGRQGGVGGGGGGGGGEGVHYATEQPFLTVHLKFVLQFHISVLTTQPKIQ